MVVEAELEPVCSGGSCRSGQAADQLRSELGRIDPADDQATPAECLRLGRQCRELRFNRVERRVAATGDEPGVREPRGDLVRLVAVEVVQLDALVAHRGNLAQRRLERLGALAPDRPER